MSSDEKKNQGAVAGTRDPQDPRAPQCNATKEDLLKKRDIDDFCLICEDYGKKVRVGAHPSQPAATTVSQLELQRAWLLDMKKWPLSYQQVAKRCAQEKPFQDLLRRLLTYQLWSNHNVSVKCLTCKKNQEMCEACYAELHQDDSKHDRQSSQSKAKCKRCEETTRRAPLVCIATSSGTGKTQLSLTAREYLQQHGGRVVYVNLSVTDTAQEVYKPHLPLGIKLMKEFSKDPVDIVEAVSDAPRLAYGLLKVLLCGNDTDGAVVLTQCGLLELETAVDQQKEKGLLVFLDEVPKRDTYKHTGFRHLLCVLRRIGVCPVLMSREPLTEAVPSNAGSRLGISVVLRQFLFINQLPSIQRRTVTTNVQRRTPLRKLNVDKIHGKRAPNQKRKRTVISSSLKDGTKVRKLET